MLVKHSDKEVVSDACWALSYLTDGSVERIQAVIDSGVVPRLVELLGSNEITCVVGYLFGGYRVSCALDKDLCRLLCP